MPTFARLFLAPAVLVSLLGCAAPGADAPAATTAGAGTDTAADTASEATADTATEAPAMAMAVYPLVLLKAGAARSEPVSDEEGARLQAAHLAHIGAMAEAGHLLLAGPMIERPGDDPIIGILLFRPGHEQAARELPAQDPLVKAGRLRAEFVRWYGPAGLTYTGDPGPRETADG